MHLMVTEASNRRDFLTGCLTGLGSAFALWVAYSYTLAKNNGDGRLYSGIITNEQKGGVWSSDLSGGTVRIEELSSRAHEIVAIENRQLVLVVSRRHGNFLQLRKEGSLKMVSETLNPKGVFFCGHAYYDAPSDTVYTGETYPDLQQGGIGRYKIVGQQLVRMGNQLLERGNPHQLYFGKSTWVAHGGVITSPDGAGKKLNLGKLKSKIIYSARLSKALSLPQENGWMSLRHFSCHPQSLNIVAVGGQDYNPDPLTRENSPMYVWSYGAFSQLSIPVGVETGGHIGSVCFDTTGDFLAFSCPKKNKILVFKYTPTAASYRFYDLWNWRDVCGLARGHEKGIFYVTTGTGRLLRLDAGKKTNSEVRSFNFSFDNHLLST